MTDLTVVIAYKNRENNIKFCVKSICERTDPPNLIIVDFGSSTPLRRLIKPYQNLKIIRITKDTKFFHKARALNIGIKCVKTKYICITDADQIFAPNFFSVILETLNTNNDSFVMCKTYYFDEITNKINIKWDLPQELLYKELLNIAIAVKIPILGDGCCNSVALSWLKEVRGYDEQYIGWGKEDSDIALRAAISGLKVVWVHDKTSMIHLPHIREGDYYKSSKKEKNKKLFLKKQEVFQEIKDVKVNKNINWGDPKKENKMTLVYGCKKNPYGENVHRDIWQDISSLLSHIDCPIVVNCGGGTGQFAASFNKALSNSVIHVFEPIESFANSIKKMNNNLNVYKSALFNVSKTAKMNITNRNEASSLLEPTSMMLDVHKSDLKIYKNYDVECGRLDGILNHVDILELHTEGTEFEALEGSMGILQSIHIIWVQVMHLELYKGQHLWYDIASFLINNNFKLYNYYAQKTRANGQITREDHLYLNRKFYEWDAGCPR
jgi:FkbM family methyltransferase